MRIIFFDILIPWGRTELTIYLPYWAICDHLPYFQILGTNHFPQFLSSSLIKPIFLFFCAAAGT